jgi:hypothetical protein
MSGRRNFQKLAARDKVRRRGAENINADAMAPKPPRPQRRQLSKAELRQPAEQAFREMTIKQNGEAK